MTFYFNCHCIHTHVHTHIYIFIYLQTFLAAFMPLPCASQHCPAFTPTIEPFYALLRPLKAIKFLSMQRMNYTEAETGPLLKGGPLREHKFGRHECSAGLPKFQFDPYSSSRARTAYLNNYRVATSDDHLTLKRRSGLQLPMTSFRQLVCVVRLGSMHRHLLVHCQCRIAYVKQF